MNYLQASCLNCGQINEQTTREPVDAGSFARILCWDCDSALMIVVLVRTIEP